MSRFVEEDEADVTPELPPRDAVVDDVAQDSDNNSDSDSNERPTLQQQLYKARQKARQENRRRAEAANPTLALKGRAKEFYGALEEARHVKREKQRDEMERELNEFKRVKRERSANTGEGLRDDDSESDVEKEGADDEIEETVENGDKKIEAANGGLVNYSDSDSD